MIGDTSIKTGGKYNGINLINQISEAIKEITRVLEGRRMKGQR